jgi:hypothetical protein
MSIPHQAHDGYGPLGTPNEGRAERIASCQARDGRRAREAAARLERGADPFESAELRSLCQEVRSLRDHLADERRAREALAAEVADLADALDYLRDLLKGGDRGKDQPRGAVA